ncbi:MAG TPA: hypothetical protein VGC99_14430 [Candidatus Tectomicrobia bacterium]
MADLARRIQPAEVLGLQVRAWTTRRRLRRWLEALDRIALGESVDVKPADQVQALKLLLAYGLGPPVRRGTDGAPPGGWRFRSPLAALQLPALPPIEAADFDDGQLQPGEQPQPAASPPVDPSGG